MFETNIEKNINKIPTYFLSYQSLIGKKIGVVRYWKESHHFRNVCMLEVGIDTTKCCFVVLLSADRNRSSKIFQQFKIQRECTADTWGIISIGAVTASKKGSISNKTSSKYPKAKPSKTCA